MKPGAKSFINVLSALFLVLLISGLPASLSTWGSDIQTVDEPARADILQDYARLPVLFVENQGQLDAEVEYYAKTSGQTIYLTDSSLVFDLIRHKETDEADLADREAERLVFSLGFVGADESPVMEGKDRDRAVVNYFIGNDPEKWFANILEL